MRYLLTLDDLLSMRTNGWGCTDCGRIWVDIAPGVAGPYEPSGNPDCRHPSIMRARVSR